MRIVLLPSEILKRLRSLFVKPPLLKPDGMKAYNDLRAALIKDIKPTNTMEWLWLKDILDHSWEIQMKSTSHSQ